MIIFILTEAQVQGDQVVPTDPFGAEIEHLFDDFDNPYTEEFECTAMVEVEKPHEGDPAIVPTYPFDEQIEHLFDDFDISYSEEFECIATVESVVNDLLSDMPSTVEVEQPNEGVQDPLGIVPTDLFGEQIEFLYYDDDIPYADTEEIESIATVEPALTDDLPSDIAPTVEAEPVEPANAASNKQDDAGVAGVAKKKQPVMLQNDFQPFDRLENVPFSVTGRPRAMSVSANFAPVEVRPRVPRRRNSILAIPTLKTIPEELDEIIVDIEKLFL